MRAVNLLPRDLERTGADGRRRVPLAVGLGGVAVVTVASVLLFLSAAGTIDERRAELALTESAIAAIPKPEGSEAPSGLVVQERADRVAALSAALSSRISVDRVLLEISYVLPEDAWLTGMIANAPTPVDPATAGPGATPQPSSSATAGVTIQGATFSHEAVARVLARLSVLPLLDNVRLTASARIEPDEKAANQIVTDVKGRKTSQKARPIVTFTIAADLVAGGAP